MNWRVEIPRIYGDEQMLRSVLEGSGYELIWERSANSDSWLLKHSKYDLFDTANPIHDDAIDLATKLKVLSRLEGEEIGLEIGDVLKMNEGGSPSKYLFASIVENLTLTGHVGAVLIRNPNISDEERSRLAEEVARQEAARKRAAKVARMRAALQKPSVLQVQELLAITEPSSTELGHIVDLIKDDYSGDLSRFSSNSELTRFYRSINHPSVLGLRARHVVTKKDPPPRPMQESEARSFAQGIGQRWLQTFEMLCLRESSTDITDLCRNVENAVVGVADLAGFNLPVEVVPDFTHQPEAEKVKGLKDTSAFYRHSTRTVYINRAVFFLQERDVQEAVLAHEIVHALVHRGSLADILLKYTGFYSDAEEFIADRIACTWGYYEGLRKERIVSYKQSYVNALDKWEDEEAYIKAMRLWDIRKQAGNLGE